VFDLREGKRSTAIKDKFGDEVLQLGLQEAITKEGFNTKQDSSELPQLSNTIHSIQEPLSNGQKEILQSEMQRPSSEINEGGEGDKIWQKAHNRVQKENGGNENKKWNEFIEGETPKLEGGKDKSSRICEHNDFNTSDGLAKNSEENATKSNIHFGASDSNGDGNEKTIIGFGERTPHKWDKERQQSKQFSDRGQSEPLKEASGNRCGNGKIEKGEPILEVLNFDVPTEWLRYFEYTGENLGCVCNGTKKVKGTSGHKSIGEDRETKFGQIKSNKVTTHYGSEEEVEQWNCDEDCPIRILDEQSGISKSSNAKRTRNTIGSFGMPNDNTPEYSDKGGASRFFYTAKSSKGERNKGLEEFDNKPPMYESHRANYENTKGIETPYAGTGRTGNENRNNHPTVKPIKLMQYLVRLITPPNGIVLDPFNGSGTTGIAAKLEGFNYVGLELDSEYCKISEARISAWEIDKPEIDNQLSLF
jgi:hypothetical protein